MSRYLSKTEFHVIEKNKPYFIKVEKHNFSKKEYAIKINSNKPVLRAAGGKERADSVLNAIKTLFNYDQFDASKDWVMVHDAVRACDVADEVHVPRAIGLT